MSLLSRYIYMCNVEVCEAHILSFSEMKSVTVTFLQ